MPLIRNPLTSYQNQSVLESYQDTNYEELNENGQYNDDQSDIIDEDALLETFLIDRIYSMTEAERTDYMNSDEFKALIDANILSERAIVRLDKASDLDRRIHLAAVQKAREAGAAEWDALRRNRIRERQLLDAIYKKYSSQVRQSAIRNQKRIIQLSPRAFDLNRPLR